MLCYLFGSGGTLLHCFHTNISDIFVPADPVFCRSRQAEFYRFLSDEDARRFALFCAGRAYPPFSPDRRSYPFPEEKTPLSCMLLRMKHAAGVTMLFTERYTAAALAEKEVLSGAIADHLGHGNIHTLAARFPNRHLTFVLLFSSAADLYHLTSPFLAYCPRLVRNLIAGLEAEGLLYPFPVSGSNISPADGADLLHTILPVYVSENRPGTLPAYLELWEITRCLLDALSRDKMFDGLYLTLEDALCRRVPMPVRFSASAFVHIFVLTVYLLANLTTDDQINISLQICGDDAVLHFSAMSARVPYRFGVRHELYSLGRLCPRLYPLISMLQFLLHQHDLDVTCTASEPYWEIALALPLHDRHPEEVEFKHSDPAAVLQDTMPETLALLRRLTDAPDLPEYRL